MNEELVKLAEMLIKLDTYDGTSPGIRYKLEAVKASLLLYIARSMADQAYTLHRIEELLRDIKRVGLKGNDD